MCRRIFLRSWRNYVHGMRCRYLRTWRRSYLHDVRGGLLHSFDGAGDVRSLHLLRGREIHSNCVHNNV